MPSKLKKPYRVLLLGRGILALHAYNAILKRKAFKLVGVSTNSQGKGVNYPYLHTLGLWKNNTFTKVPYIDSLNNPTDMLKEFVLDTQVDIILSIQYNWVLPEFVLSRVNLALNYHNGKLPEYGGFNSVNWAIYNKEKVHVSTIHKMENEVDAGYIFMEKETPILKGDTAISLYDRSMENSKIMINSCLDRLAKGGPIPLKPQEGKKRFYSKHEFDDMVKHVFNAAYFPPYFEKTYDKN